VKEVNTTDGNQPSKKEYVKFNGGLQVSFWFIGTTGNEPAGRSLVGS
jgi:hypothetical protein